MTDKERGLSVKGTVQASNGTYIIRREDHELFDLCQKGDFCYVLAARQMGKSSLMINTVEHLNEEGCHTAVIDLTQIGSDLTAEQWYQGLIDMLAKQLSLDIDIAGWWRENTAIGTTQRLLRFFREILLVQVSGDQVIIFIDEIEVTLRLPFSDDFFAAIRAVYNVRALEEEFRRLSFVLLGVAAPNELISDSRRTPFNIGNRVEMSYFNSPGIARLMDPWEADQKQKQVIADLIHSWTNGHPYLTQRILFKLLVEDKEAQIDSIDGSDIDRLVNQVFLSSLAWQDTNLSFVRDMLTKPRLIDSQEVLQVYWDIIHSRGIRMIPDEELSPVKLHLKLSGVVRRNENRHLDLTNKIYGEVFSLKWAEKHYSPELENESFGESSPYRWDHSRSLVNRLFGHSTFRSLLLITAGFFIAHIAFRYSWPSIVEGDEAFKAWLELTFNSGSEYFNDSNFRSGIVILLLSGISLLLSLLALAFTRNAFYRSGAARALLSPLTNAIITSRIEVRAYLIVLAGDDSVGKQLELYGDTPIGRSQQNAEILLQEHDENSPLSRLHCTIIDEEDHFLIRDEGSANGTYLNGSRLQPSVVEELVGGDEIELARVERGGVRLQFLIAHDQDTTSMNDRLLTQPTQTSTEQPDDAVTDRF